MSTTTEDEQEIVEHLANTRGYDQEVKEIYDLTQGELRGIMRSAGYEKCECERWSKMDARCGCGYSSWIGYDHVNNTFNV